MDASDQRKPISRIKNTSNFNSNGGKLPPQAIDVEQVVLGAMMLEKEAVNDTIDILNQDSFYDPKHQYIFKVYLSQTTYILYHINIFDQGARIR